MSRGSLCPGGHSWSLDLDKCMDCAICLQRTKNDFCAKCKHRPQDSRLWLAVGGAVGGVVVLSVVVGALLWTHCRRREQFTSE
uniref:Tumor necrosis factor receptor superfamily member 12A n=1 Tax=Pelusios castaneus TaxID=367368 RepID=A0A8C8S4W8_9SAUR